VSDRAAAVALRGIGKRFGAVVANSDIDLAVRRGSIHGIVGENGAGKTTLMNILYGSLQPDRGEIAIGGETVRLRSPAEAIAHGIGMVHQHFMLVDRFTVIENLLLGAAGGPLLAGAEAQARSALAGFAAAYGLTLDPDAVVEDLPLGLRQRVEIVKALHRGAEILILDEPTAVLTPQEADHLFEILRRLAGEGRTIILVTHKLREIMAATERVTVMRRGAVVAERATAETDAGELAALILGHAMPQRARPARRAVGGVVLEVAGLSLRDASGQELLRDVALTVRSGEIVGVAGISGNGQSELLEIIAGLVAPSAGSVALNGRDITTLTGRERRRLGLGHIPEDRQRMGLVPQLSAALCAILGDQRKAARRGMMLLDHAAIDTATEALMHAYDVRPPEPTRDASKFSGGNQQKLVCAREMEGRPAALLVGQPTRGVDIGAIDFIHQRLVALRDAGCAILLVSVELDEIRSLADRILVMSRGAIVGAVAPTAPEAELGLMMAGIGVYATQTAVTAPS
jgi:ABC-type uncharacterized transport system ATPase subunit